MEELVKAILELDVPREKKAELMKLALDFLGKIRNNSFRVCDILEEAMDYNRQLMDILPSSESINKMLELTSGEEGGAEYGEEETTPKPPIIMIEVPNGGNAALAGRSFLFNVISPRPVLTFGVEITNCEHVPSTQNSFDCTDDIYRYEYEVYIPEAAAGETLIIKAFDVDGRMGLMQMTIQ